MGDDKTYGRLPGVDTVIASAGIDDGRTPMRRVVVDAVREVLDGLRLRLSRGLPVGDDEFGPANVAARALKLAADRTAGSLKPVINLTGVVVHTNLGRAPLSRSLVREVEDVLCSYTNIEYDLDAGRRGSRYDHVTRLLRRLVPEAGSALVVNNNAAAVLLILTALARERDVVVSRGELIEIGGGFRIPDVMAQSGARLVEVGTTNRTSPADYESAVGPDTALLFKAHRSNFRIVGFTREADWSELGRLARDRGIPFVADLGSGLMDRAGTGLPEDEPTPSEVLAAGAGLVCFSGDKLLGGPQAGIILGEAGLVDRLKEQPLLRALRVDRFTIAALEATLKRYLVGDTGDIPVSAAVRASDREVRSRCARVIRIARRKGAVGPGLRLKVVRTQAEVGGGSVPGSGIRSFGIEISVPGMSEDDVARFLRAYEPPVIGRVAQGRVLLDMRTLLPGQERIVAGALAALTRRESPQEV